eukprot:g7452.t1
MLAEPGPAALLDWPQRQQRLEHAQRHCAASLRAVHTNIESAVMLAKLQLLAADALMPQQPVGALDVVLATLRRVLVHCDAHPEPWPVSEDDEEHATTARGLLALLLCQRANPADDREAAALLQRCGHRFRLSREIFHYEEQSGDSEGGGAAAGPSPTGTFVYAVDGLLAPAAFDRLQRLFGPCSEFWRAHQYDAAHWTTRPYFSYLHELRTLCSPARNVMEATITAVHRLLLAHWPEEMADARFAEWWAHCRPHHSGHQLHFDSEDEGRGELRHPLFSTVLYLSGAGIGGPTLVTAQRKGDSALPKEAYLAFPAANRLVAFAGDRLHGVIPGRGEARPTLAGSRTPHRITLMIAFWRDVKRRAQLHEDGSIAASHPWPAADAPGWHRGFDGCEEPVVGAAPARVAPQRVRGAVWQPLSERKSGGGRGDGDQQRSFVEGLGWQDRSRMPSYEQCFAGV